MPSNKDACERISRKKYIPYDKAEGIVIIHWTEFNSYSSTVQHINRLFSEAKQDFPNLKESDVSFCTYEGIAKGRYSYIVRGIEFVRLLKDIPDSYALERSRETLDIT